MPNEIVKSHRGQEIVIKQIGGFTIAPSRGRPERQAESMWSWSVPDFDLRGHESSIDAAFSAAKRAIDEGAKDAGLTAEGIEKRLAKLAKGRWEPNSIGGVKGYITTVHQVEYECNVNPSGDGFGFMIGREGKLMQSGKCASIEDGKKICEKFANGAESRGMSGEKAEGTETATHLAEGKVTKFTYKAADIVVVERSATWFDWSIKGYDAKGKATSKAAAMAEAREEIDAADSSARSIGMSSFEDSCKKRLEAFAGRDGKKLASDNRKAVSNVSAALQSAERLLQRVAGDAEKTMARVIFPEVLERISKAIVACDRES
jgi:hypothetical protein